MFLKTNSKAYIQYKLIEAYLTCTSISLQRKRPFNCSNFHAIPVKAYMPAVSARIKICETYKVSCLVLTQLRQFVKEVIKTSRVNNSYKYQICHLLTEDKCVLYNCDRLLSNSSFTKRYDCRALVSAFQALSLANKHEPN